MLKQLPRLKFVVLELEILDLVLDLRIEVFLASFLERIEILEFLHDATICIFKSSPISFIVKYNPISILPFPCHFCILIHLRIDHRRHKFFLERSQIFLHEPMDIK